MTMQGLSRRTFLVALLAGVSYGAYGAMIELDDDSFEHDTQAASGATTGDWFVMFYTKGATKAVKCGTCAKYLPVWEKIGQEVATRKAEGSLYVNVAKVNIDATPNLKVRFRRILNKLPSIVLFKQGKMYHMAPPLGEMEDILEFATDKFADTAPYSIPPEPSFLQRMLRWIQGDEL